MSVWRTTVQQKSRLERLTGTTRLLFPLCLAWTIPLTHPLTDSLRLTDWFNSEYHFWKGKKRRHIVLRKCKYSKLKSLTGCDHNGKSTNQSTWTHTHTHLLSRLNSGVCFLLLLHLHTGILPVCHCSSNHLRLTASQIDQCASKHLLGGSGAVDGGSIGDRVELDRLWLPSLLHVPRKNPAGAPSNTRTAWMMGERCTEYGAASDKRSQVTRFGLTAEP